MNNILAACLLSSLIACTLDDPYMPVNPEEKPAPPVVTEYQPVALTIGANGRFDVSGSSVKIGLNGKNSTYGVCLPQIAQGHFIAEVTADKTTNFGLAIVREKNGKPDFNNYTSVSVCTESGVSTTRQYCPVRPASIRMALPICCSCAAMMFTRLRMVFAVWSPLPMWMWTPHPRLGPLFAPALRSSRMISYRGSMSS